MLFFSFLFLLFVFLWLFIVVFESSFSSFVSEYEREKNKRVEENNRLLRALGLLTTDFDMAAGKRKNSSNSFAFNKQFDPQTTGMITDLLVHMHINK